MFRPTESVKFDLYLSLFHILNATSKIIKFYLLTAVLAAGVMNFARENIFLCEGYGGSPE